MTLMHLLHVWQGLEQSLIDDTVALPAAQPTASKH